MDAVFDAFVKDVSGPVIDGRKGRYEADSSLPGAHNRQNAGLALAMAVALGADEAEFLPLLLNQLKGIGPGQFGNYLLHIRTD